MSLKKCVAALAAAVIISGMALGLAGCDVPKTGPDDGRTDHPQTISHEDVNGSKYDHSDST